MFVFAGASSNFVDVMNPVVVGDLVVLIVGSVIDTVDSAIVVVDSMTVFIDCVVVVVDFLFDIVDSLVDCMARHPRSKNEQINLIINFVQKYAQDYRLYLLSLAIYE